MDKSPDAFRTISEVADHLQTPAHVLRFWESRFPQVRPVKRAGGRRYYRPSDVALLAGIRRLLHDEGLTIRGVQKILREQGVRHVSGLTDEEMEAADAAADAIPADAPPPPAPEGEVVWLAPQARDRGADPAPLPEDPAAFAGDAPSENAAPGAAEPAATGPEALPGPPEPEPEPEPAEAIMPAAPPPADDLPLFARPAPPAAPGSALAAPPDASAPDLGLAALTARLRALPPGALQARHEELGPLFLRLAGLRNTLAERGRRSRR